MPAANRSRRVRPGGPGADGGTPKHLGYLKEAVRAGRRPGLDEGRPNGAIGLKEALRELLRRHETG